MEIEKIMEEYEFSGAQKAKIKEVAEQIHAGYGRQIVDERVVIKDVVSAFGAVVQDSVRFDLTEKIISGVADYCDPEKSGQPTESGSATALSYASRMLVAYATSEHFEEAAAVIRHLTRENRPGDNASAVVSATDILLTQKDSPYVTGVMQIVNYATDNPGADPIAVIQRGLGNPGCIGRLVEKNMSNGG